MSVVFFVHKLLLSLYFLGNSMHPYHVSATELEYEPQHKRLEISTKIFTDDFEHILSKTYKQKVDLTREDWKPQMTKLITHYIVTHLSIKNNNRQLSLKLFEWEIDHEAVYVYLTADAPTFDPAQIIVEKSVLYDLFDDQVNIIHFIYNKKRISTKLAYPEKKAIISFTGN